MPDRLRRPSKADEDLTNRGCWRRYNPWYAALVGHCGVIRDVVGGSLAGPDARRVPGRSVDGRSVDGTRRIFLQRRNWLSRRRKLWLGSAPGLGPALWSSVRHRITSARFPLGWLLQRFSPAGFRLPAFPSPRLLWLGVPGLLRVLRLSRLLRRRLSTRPRITIRVTTTTDLRTPPLRTPPRTI